MKLNNLIKCLGAVTAVLVVGLSCTNLNQKVYSVVPNSEFWQTPAEIAAGVAPAYNVLTSIPNGSIEEIVEASTDEMIIPIRGSDWLDADEHVQEWQHTWPDNHPNISSAWGTIFQGIGEANFTIGVVQGLPKPPSDTTAIYAELRGLRAYYYFLALDLFGNVPIVTSFNVNPASVKTSSRLDVYNFVVSELNAIIPNLASDVDPTTYGRFTKWAAFSLLAKLYLNANVYLGSAPGTSAGSSTYYPLAMAACDSVILSGNYALPSDFFDNFSTTNSNNTGSGWENIFVVPFDKVNIPNNNWEMGTLHYQNNVNFQLSGSPWNGFCSDADFYSTFDTTSLYTTKGTTVYRTFLDQRAGQYLVGQQYSIPFTYPPSTGVVYSADPSLALQDLQFSIPLVFTPAVPVLSNSAGNFRGAGVRNIKYFPEAGTSGSQSNDMVLFRLADIYLMRAEADMRANGGAISATSLGYVNAVRERAYGATTPTIPNPNNAAQPIQVQFTNAITLDNILAERGRELTWECWRRNDLIRFETESGTPYWSGPRNPQKTQDADNHFMLFPIPTQYITANPNLTQNPGY
jgi:starch-binding outer membrane protein, SusD/RagB family